jgi:hypothetical protein
MRGREWFLLPPFPGATWLRARIMTAQRQILPHFDRRATYSVDRCIEFVSCHLQDRRPVTHLVAVVDVDILIIG